VVVSALLKLLELGGCAGVAQAVVWYRGDSESLWNRFIRPFQDLCFNPTKVMSKHKFVYLQMANSILSCLSVLPVKRRALRCYVCNVWIGCHWSKMLACCAYRRAAVSMDVFNSFPCFLCDPCEKRELVLLTGSLAAHNHSACCLSSLVLSGCT
jgi:hypothetical protein